MSSPWFHHPSPPTLLWLTISLPLVLWDTIYVLLRPHTMPGGSLHWPIWVPYDLYGRVDYVYGWHAWDARNGFTGAQGLMNAFETGMYLFYLWRFVCCKGRKGGRGEGLGLVVGFGAAVMTLSKTVLYWANEYYSGFAHIGHNSARDLVFLWIIPNGAWLVGSSYMIWEMGRSILDGLEIASNPGKKTL